MENYGMKLTQLDVVFAYRLSVGIAIILIVINVQIFLSAIFAEDVPQNAPFIAGGLLLASFVYGFFTINNLMSKITIYEEGIEIKSIIKRRFISSANIKNVEFHRRSPVRMKITLHVENAGIIIINTAKYKSPEPLINFCQKFKTN